VHTKRHILHVIAYFLIKRVCM